ncbi:MAG: adenylate kinase [Sandaracinaceae bacterium]|nr:adenylate kinase [Sandaracinaceae bacterium]
MIVILLGPPGAGKGTQAKRLSERTGWFHFSTGDRMRQERAAGTDLGRQFDLYMAQGMLVPDDLVMRLVKKQIEESASAKGIVFDGFPRTIAQAHALDSLLGAFGKSVDHVIVFDVSEEVVVERITGRRVCEACGKVYHVVFEPPPLSGKCLACGSSQIVQRNDDSEETVRKRYRLYLQGSEAIIQHYSRVLLKVDASQVADVVTRNLFEMLKL